MWPCAASRWVFIFIASRQHTASHSTPPRPINDRSTDFYHEKHENDVKEKANDEEALGSTKLTPTKTIKHFLLLTRKTWRFRQTAFYHPCLASYTDITDILQYEAGEMIFCVVRRNEMRKIVNIVCVLFPLYIHNIYTYIHTCMMYKRHIITCKMCGNVYVHHLNVFVWNKKQLFDGSFCPYMPKNLSKTCHWFTPAFHT